MALKLFHDKFLFINPVPPCLHLDSELLQEVTGISVIVDRIDNFGNCPVKILF